MAAILLLQQRGPAAGAAVIYSKKNTAIAPGLNMQEVQRLPVPAPLQVPAPLPPQLATGESRPPAATPFPTPISDPATAPLHYWLIKGTGHQGWRINLGLADAHNITKKRSVRLQAASLSAPVVVNGGFFAYGGGALGAVRLDGSWQRAAWKNRTAVGWTLLGDKRISNLATSIRVTLGILDFESVTLNSLSRAYSYAQDNGYAVMTGFGTPYVVLPRNCAALAVQNDRVVQRYEATTPETVLAAPGSTPSAPAPANALTAIVPPGGWLLVSLIPANNPTLDVPLGSRAVWDMISTPAVWSRFPNILGAGPRLLAHGKVFTTEKVEEFRADVLARGPRTAVGWDKNGNWMLLVIDGRQALSAGATLPECAELFRRNGAVEAVNLDGGSSTQLVVRGQLTNRPSAVDQVDPTRQREVQVPNVLYFVKQGTGH